jgi:hypothetical protein
MLLDQSQRISAKLLLDMDAASLNLDRVVPVFHRWIQKDQLPDEMPIDVANYGHVKNGPGVLLICHRGHYGIDLQGGKPGIRFAGKRDLKGSAKDRLRAVILATLKAARLLRQEKSLGDWPAPQHQIEFSFDDRLLTPNNSETYEAIAPIVRELWLQVLPDSDPQISQGDVPGRPLTIQLTGTEELDLEAMIGKLSEI